MWMGKQLARRAKEEEADTGTVTAAGAMLCAVTDGEKRNLTVYSPGGYRWQPEAGQKVLVLKNGAVCGKKQEGGHTLQPGEIEICGPDGALLRMEKDGKIVIMGDIAIEGSVALQGDLNVSGIVSCAALIVAGKNIG